MIDVTLRSRLTPFGEALASVLTLEADGLRLRVVSAGEAIDPMRRLVARLGMGDRYRVFYKDGAPGVSWSEQPGLFIQRWVNQESAIVLKEDAQGPVELRFFMRLAADTVRTTYRIGNAEGERALHAAFWDLGIRRFTAQLQRDTPGSFIAMLRGRYEGKPTYRFTLTAQADGGSEQLLTMEERPR